MADYLSTARRGWVFWLLVSVAALCGGEARAQAAASPAPPSGPVRLAFTFTSPTEVAFIDLASLHRSGDVVEGWSLNVFAEAFQPDYAPAAAPLHWSRVRIDCAAQTARFTRGVGIVEGAPVFDVRIETADVRVRDGWVLDEQYACQGQAPARPVVESVEAAIDTAREIMSSDVWAEDPA